MLGLKLIHVSERGHWSQGWSNTGSDINLAECSLIIGMGYQVFSLILTSPVGLWAGIKCAGEWVSESDAWARILVLPEEDNLSPCDSKSLPCANAQLKQKNKDVYTPQLLNNLWLMYEHGKWCCHLFNISVFLYLLLIKYGHESWDIFWWNAAAIYLTCELFTSQKNEKYIKNV